MRLITLTTMAAVSASACFAERIKFEIDCNPPPDSDWYQELKEVFDSATDFGSSPIVSVIATSEEIARLEELYLNNPPGSDKTIFTFTNDRFDALYSYSCGDGTCSLQQMLLDGPNLCQQSLGEPCSYFALKHDGRHYCLLSAKVDLGVEE